MTKPTPYERQHSFTDHSSEFPNVQPPGAKLDAEFNALKTTTDDIRTNLALIQRDDGLVANGAIGVEQLGSTALALIASGAFRVRGAWAAATDYDVGDMVSSGGVVCLTVEGHVSADFDGDIAAGRLVPAFDPAQAILEDRLAEVTGLGMIGAAGGLSAQEALDAKISDVDLALPTAAAAIGAASGMSVEAELAARMPIAALQDAGGSANIGFSQPGIVGVPRTIEQEMRDRSVNIMGHGAVADGVEDDSAAFLSAISTGRPVFLPNGTYHIGNGVNIPTGADLILIGDEPGQVIIKGNQDFNGFKNGLTTPCGNVFLRNIAFDGGVVRTTFPYAASIPLNPRGLRSGVSLFGDKTLSTVDIEGCTFSNFSSLPFLLSHFARARVSGCRFIRTYDPGFRWCREVIWMGNLSLYSADNGVSISRGCKYVTVTGNIFKDCEESGIWLSGYGVALTGNVTLTGSYVAGGAVTLTADTANFDSSQIGGYITLISGADEATVKITSTPSGTVANGITVAAVPASLQGIATATWNLSPAFGVEGATITGNLIIGCLETGVRGDIAPRNMTINGNTFLRAGWTADSEAATTGTVLASSNSLTLADPSDFATDDYIILETTDSYRDYHIARVTGLVGSVATISPAPDVAYIAETVRKIHVEDGSFDTGNFIVLAGSATGIPDKSASNIVINGNLMVDAAGSGIVLGGSNGPVSKVLVSANQIEYKSTAGPYATGLRYSIHMRETIASSEISHVTIHGNMLAGFSNNVRLSQKGATARTGIVVSDNVYPTGLAFSAVNSDAGSASVTSLYSTSAFDKWGTQAFDNIGATFNSRTPSGSSLTIDRFLIAVAGPVTITDLLRPVGSTAGIFVIRNSNTSGGTDITITHNNAKIRTQTGADLLIKPGAAAMFAFINDTVAVQIG